MSAPRRRRAWIAGVLLAWLGATAGHAGDGDLEDLRRRLLEAREPVVLDGLLDAVVQALGEERPGAVGDWLGRLPEPVAGHPRVLLRRGWAYVAAGRAKEAERVLEAAREAGADPGPTLAYLGEARRQQGDPEGAMQALVAAAEAGYGAPFLRESVHKTAFELRRDRPASEAEGLPDYARALDAYLAARDDEVLHAVAARWALEDHDAYALEDAPRFRLWARFAADHALAALRLEPGLPGGARLALDAAVALAPEDAETPGRTARFDLLAWACRLGDRRDEDRHEVPAALALLAEAALGEGRYELASRLAAWRLELGDSPAARRVLDALPPDVGQ